MKKYYYTIALLTMTAVITITFAACQNRADDDHKDIQQVDTSGVMPSDNVTPTPDTTLTSTGQDTSKSSNMKDTATKKPLVLVIENLESPSAPVEISVYSPREKFPTPDGQLKKYRFTPAGKQLTVELKDLDYGQYAVATYQDLDADGQIGKNIVGIPTDPYGFSNNYKPKIKAPAFKDCEFAYNDQSAPVSITMIRK